jgi:molybdate transport system substrate-binding protein
MKIARRLALLVAALFAGTQPAAAGQAPQPLLVYAASSLTNVLDELGAAYTSASGQAVKLSYASSATLARQIEAGANADVFLSADTDWMDYLKSRNLINNASRIDLLGNRLVLVAPVDSPLQLKIAPGFGLRAALGDSRLSTGDPDSVPVGKYARAALQSLGVWNEVADRLVRADNVRAALAFVDRGEAALGIVYASDALVDKKVRVVDVFPVGSHPPIVYPVALTTSAGSGPANFIAFLRSTTAQAAFIKYGFTVLP